MKLKRYLAPVVFGAALLGACADDPTGLAPAESAPAPRVLGLVEITFTGVGTPQMSASISPVGASAGGARFAVSPAVVGEDGRTGLQIGGRSASTLEAGGQRYLQAVFQVRNASADGVAYTTARSNVSFIPVGTATTLAGTPVSRFRKQDGTEAAAEIAQQLRPTGAVAADANGGTRSQYPDVLQLFTEQEVAGIDMGSAPGVTNRFPYGFVVRRVGSASTRALPAAPAPGQFDGAVTFGYRFPIQDNPADNPFTISVMALAVEEAETHVSQSLEEQNAVGRAEFQARAASLSAAAVSLLPGAGFTGSAIPRTLCNVRTAGTAGSASTVLGPCQQPSLLAVECTATLGTPSVTCGGSAYVHLQTSNLTVAGGIVEFDLTVQNLLNEGIGTPDGVRVDTAAIPVVFTSEPAVTGGTGTATVANADGLRPSQPFFRFDQKLVRDEVSAARTVRIAYDPGVTSFRFTLAVKAEIQPLLVINEFLANVRNPVLDSDGEWIEVYNAGGLPVQMEGMLIADSTASGRRPYHRIASPLLVQPGGYVVLGRSSNTAFNGGVPVDYAYGGALDLGNALDAIKLSRPYASSDTLTLDRAQYSQATISAQDGISRELKNPGLDNSNADGPAWADALVIAVYGSGGRGTPRAQNSAYTP
jgi:hypothetical protein